MSSNENDERATPGHQSAAARTRACIERIEADRADPDGLNAWLSVDGQGAMTAAESVDRDTDAGPLSGLPIAIKDNICTRAVPTTCGSRLLDGYVSPFEATAVTRLRAAGAVILGKTNLDEFGMGGTGESSAFGPTRNPLGHDRVPGGSSSGSAAAVAAGHCPVALGSDTGGSVRQPAAFCGVVGLKPSYGRVSRRGLVAFASSLDQVGVVARSVTDAARVLEVIAGHDPRDATSADVPVEAFAEAARRGAGRADLSGAVIGLPAEVFGPGIGLAVDVDRCVRAAVALAESHGATVREISLPHLRYAVATYYLICTAEASSNLARLDGLRYGNPHDDDADDIVSAMTRTRTEGFGAEVKRRILLGTFVLGEGYQDQYVRRAQRARTRIRRDHERAFESCDLIALPTAPRTAFELGEVRHDPLQMYLGDTCTVAASLAGLPALSLPCGSGDDGMPIGLQLVAPYLAEGRLLELGAALHTALAPERRGGRET